VAPIRLPRGRPPPCGAAMRPPRYAARADRPRGRHLRRLRGTDSPRPGRACDGRIREAPQLPVGATCRSPGAVAHGAESRLDVHVRHHTAGGRSPGSEDCGGWCRTGGGSGRGAPAPRAQGNVNTADVAVRAPARQRQRPGCGRWWVGARSASSARAGQRQHRRRGRPRPGVRVGRFWSAERLLRSGSATPTARARRPAGTNDGVSCRRQSPAAMALLLRNVAPSHSPAATALSTVSAASSCPALPRCTLSVQ